ncbi:MAG: hypothetical protein IH599_00845, partial [Bacteroidales bacterium]|nr:hypothetical protein [Bacteroidales bacterium]
QGLGNGSSKTVSPSSTVIYTITGTDGNACTATDDVTITVNPLPTVLLTAGTDSICPGDSTLLMASGASSYTWSIAGAGGNQASVAPLSTSTYSVTGTDASGCSNNSQATVTLFSAPSFSLMPYGPVCTGDTALLSVNGGASWQWSTGQSVPSILVSPPASTAYFVTVSSSDGCTAVGSIFQSVEPVPVLTFSPPSPVCIDDAAFVPDFVSPSGGIYAGPGISGNLFNPQIAGPGIHQLSYIYSFASGCGADTLLSVEVELKFRLEGGMYYDGKLFKPMDSSSVMLAGQGSGFLDTLDVNNGLFSFRCLDNDLYQLQPVTQTAWGGVNATDALAAAQFSVSQLALDPLRRQAADVNGSGFVNAGDALWILRRFVNIVDSFPVPDWVLPATLHQLSGASIDSLVLGVICAGDVNGSYNPYGTKSAPWLELRQRGTMPDQAEGSIIIDVYLNADAMPSAVSLVLEWPEDGLLGIENLAEGGLYDLRGGVLRVGAYTADDKGFDMDRPYFRLIWDTRLPFVMPVVLDGSEISDAGGKALNRAGLTFAFPAVGRDWTMRARPNPVYGGEEVVVENTGVEGELSWALLAMDGRIVAQG